MDEKIKQIKPMDCPVCGRFYFSESSDFAIKNGISPNDAYCSVCGWHYDLEQLQNPDLPHQANEMSLNQYREWYQEKIAANRKWEYYDEIADDIRPHQCPVCGEFVFENTVSYEICPICGWQDTGFEDCPDETASTSPKDMSFNDRRSWFKKQREKNPNYCKDDEIYPNERKKRSFGVKGTGPRRSLLSRRGVAYDFNRETGELIIKAKNGRVIGHFQNVKGFFYQARRGDTKIAWIMK